MLSIDIALRSFAYCKLENNKITDIGFLNFLETEHICSSTTKTGMYCNNKASWKYLDKYYCGIHCENNYIKLGQCSTILKNGKQCSRISRFIKDNNEFCGQHKVDEATEFNRKIKQHSFNHICDSVIKGLTTLPKCPIIVIENQPNINQTMKNIQIMVATYFRMQGCSVEFMDAKKKYRWCNIIIPPKNYDERKKLSITKCMELLDPEWTTQISKFRKKDDICDAISIALSYNKM